VRQAGNKKTPPTEVTQLAGLKFLAVKGNQDGNNQDDISKWGPSKNGLLFSLRRVSM